MSEWHGMTDEEIEERIKYIRRCYWQSLIMLPFALATGVAAVWFCLWAWGWL